MTVEELKVSVGEVFWPRMPTANQRVMTCSPLLGLRARELLDSSRNGKSDYKDLLDLEKRFEDSGIPDALRKLTKVLPVNLHKITKGLVIPKRPRQFLLESDAICGQIHKLNQTQRQALSKNYYSWRWLLMLLKIADV
jgi:hypothetical protein